MTEKTPKTPAPKTPKTPKPVTPTARYETRTAADGSVTVRVRVTGQGGYLRALAKFPTEAEAAAFVARAMAFGGAI